MALHTSFVSNLPATVESTEVVESKSCPDFTSQGRPCRGWSLPGREDNRCRWHASQVDPSVTPGLRPGPGNGQGRKKKPRVDMMELYRDEAREVVWEIVEDLRDIAGDPAQHPMARVKANELILKYFAEEPDKNININDEGTKAKNAEYRSEIARLRAERRAEQERLAGKVIIEMPADTVTEVPDDEQ